jgi:hypothetical protein
LDLIPHQYGPLPGAHPAAVPAKPLESALNDEAENLGRRYSNARNCSGVNP